MSKVIDLTGQKFGRLTVIERAPDKIYSTGRKAIAWRCVCDCGNEVIVTRSELINKKRKNVSCGCWKRENAMIQLNKIHNGELKSYKKYNKYDLSGEYGIGYVDFPDSEGRNYFYFDLEDYEKIKNYSWHFSRDYVEAWDYLSEQAHKTIKLHRLVMNCTDNLQVDHIFHKKYDDVKYRIVTIAGVLGNCAFMGVPLLEALLPDYPQAVVFSAVYSITMNLIGWTVVSAIITNDKKYIKLKNFILNPSVIALCAALPLFFKGIYIGDTRFGSAVFLLAKMTTPMCMLIMGMRLGSVSLKPVVTRKLNYLVLFLKQAAMPIAGLLIVLFLPIDTNMKLTFYIICCCPVASVVLNFSEMLGQGQEMASNLVLLGTFSSVVTIPIMMLLSGVIV